MSITNQIPPQDLRSFIFKLGLEEKCKLGAVICKSLFPDYQKFMTNNDCYGDVDLLKKTVHTIQHASLKEMDKNLLEAYLAAVDNQVYNIGVFSEEFEFGIEDPTEVTCAELACQA